MFPSLCSCANVCVSLSGSTIVSAFEAVLVSAVVLAVFLSGCIYLCLCLCVPCACECVIMYVFVVMVVFVIEFVFASVFVFVCSCVLYLRLTLCG